MLSDLLNNSLNCVFASGWLCCVPGLAPVYMLTSWPCSCSAVCQDDPDSSATYTPSTLTSAYRVNLTLNSSCCFITWWHPATLGIDLEPLWNRWWKVTALETVYKELVYCSYSAAAWSLLCFCSLSGHQSYWVLGLYSSANIETQLLAKLIDQQHNIKRELLLLYRLCCYSQCSGNKRQELKHLEIDFQWE